MPTIHVDCTQGECFLFFFPAFWFSGSVVFTVLLNDKEAVISSNRLKAAFVEDTSSVYLNKSAAPTPTTSAIANALDPVSSSPIPNIVSSVDSSYSLLIENCAYLSFYTLIIRGHLLSQLRRFRVCTGIPVSFWLMFLGSDMAYFRSVPPGRFADFLFTSHHEDVVRQATTQSLHPFTGLR